MATTEVPASLDDDLPVEDWFGEGSVFDSGEDLAAALLALAISGPAAARGAVAVPAATFDSAVSPPLGSRPPSGPSRIESQADQIGEFQVAAMPSFATRQPGVGASHGVGWQRSAVAAPRPQATGWSIRESVQILRTTEELLVRLREEAAALAWEWAAAVHREVAPAGAGVAALSD